MKGNFYKNLPDNIDIKSMALKAIPVIETIGFACYVKKKLDNIEKKEDEISEQIKYH